MYIHSLSRLLSLPLILMAAGIVWYSLTVDNTYSWLIFIPISLLVVLYVFHGPIDFYWHRKYPPKFDKTIQNWLEKHFPYYNEISGQKKERFQQRLSLYISARAFTSVGKEKNDNVPEDIKCMIAAHAVQMSIGLDDYLIGDFDRIFLYKHPFPSPDMPWLHNMEVNTEDGMIILSLEQQINAVLRPEEYYNIAAHAYAESLLYLYPELKNVPIDESWTVVTDVAGWHKDHVLKSIGHKEVDHYIVHLHAFFHNPLKYKLILPQSYHHFNSILKAFEN